MTTLFDPITLGDLQLPNRIIMAPLTRCRADEGRVPVDGRDPAPARFVVPAVDRPRAWSLVTRFEPEPAPNFCAVPESR